MFQPRFAGLDDTFDDDAEIETEMGDLNDIGEEIEINVNGNASVYENQFFIQIFHKLMGKDVSGSKGSSSPPCRYRPITEYCWVRRHRCQAHRAAAGGR